MNMCLKRSVWVFCELPSPTSFSIHCDHRLLDAECIGRFCLTLTERSRLQRCISFSDSLFEPKGHVSTATNSVLLQTFRGACLMKRIRVPVSKTQSVTKCENVCDAVTTLYRRRSHSRTGVLLASAFSEADNALTKYSRDKALTKFF